MTDLREAAEAALQALEHSTTHGSLTGAEWVFEEVEAATTALREALANPAVPPGYALVPVEPTPEMVAEYLKANDAYWRRTDELPMPPDKWRTGTPSEATAESYRAMLAAAPQPKDKPCN